MVELKAVKKTGVIVEVVKITDPESIENLRAGYYFCDDSSCDRSCPRWNNPEIYSEVRESQRGDPLGIFCIEDLDDLTQQEEFLFRLGIIKKRGEDAKS